MLNIKRILVPTDLSPSADRAAAIAAAFAGKFEAEIHILHVTTAPEKGPLEEFFRFLLSHPEQQKKREQVVLERLEKDMRRHLAEPESTIRHIERPGASAALTIVDYAVESDADMIVMGTHGHRSIEHALGGTTGEVLRRAKRPLMTVRDGASAGSSDGHAALERVLVPIDFSESSRDSVIAAYEIAERFGSSVTLLFAAEERSVPIFNDTGRPTFTTIRMEPEVVASADEALQLLYQDVAGADARATTVIRSGKAAREILAYAREQEVGLIVMSTHGHTGDELFTLGSVAERVARGAGCPVLTLDPLGRSIIRR